MRTMLPLVSVAILSCMAVTAAHRHDAHFLDAPPAHDAINAVLGDISFVERFGALPTVETSEDLRIRTHLAHVEQMLRARSVDHLTQELQATRLRHLDNLHAYWTQGIFPRNDSGMRQRLPTFIDNEGRLCAVGYLVEQSAGREAAERINAQHKYELIADMRSPLLDAWTASSGLTKAELAMIQPQYDDGGCSGCIRNNVVDGFPAETVTMVFNAAAVVGNGALAATDHPSLFFSGVGLVASAVGFGFGVSRNAEYRNASLLLAGASLLASTWSLTEALRPDTGTPEQAAYVPDARVSISPVRTATSGPSLSLQWAF